MEPRRKWNWLNWLRDQWARKSIEIWESYSSISWQYIMTSIITSNTADMATLRMIWKLSALKTLLRNLKQTEWAKETGMLGQHWLDGFLRCNPTLAIHKAAESFSQARAIGLNAAVVKHGLTNLAIFCSQKVFSTEVIKSGSLMKPVFRWHSNLVPW